MSAASLPANQKLFHCRLRYSTKSNSNKTSKSSFCQASQKFDYNSRQGEYSKETDFKKGKPEKDDVLAEIHGNMPAFAAKDARIFWSEMDAKDRANSRNYFHGTIAFPNALTVEQQKETLRLFCDELAEDLFPDFEAKFPYSAFIHQSKLGINEHAHFMFSLKANDGVERKPAQFFSRHFKNRAPKDCGAPKFTGNLNDKKFITPVRKIWERVANEQLKKFGHDQFIDRRSYIAQGLELVPQKHVGAASYELKNRTAANNKKQALETKAFNFLLEHDVEKAEKFQAKANKIDTTSIETARYEENQKAIKQQQSIDVLSDEISSIDEQIKQLEIRKTKQIKSSELKIKPSQNQNNIDGKGDEKMKQAQQVSALLKELTSEIKKQNEVKQTVEESAPAINQQRPAVAQNDFDIFGDDEPIKPKKKEVNLTAYFEEKLAQKKAKMLEEQNLSAFAGHEQTQPTTLETLRGIGAHISNSVSKKDVINSGIWNGAAKKLKQEFFVTGETTDTERLGINLALSFNDEDQKGYLERMKALDPAQFEIAVKASQDAHLKLFDLVMKPKPIYTPTGMIQRLASLSVSAMKSVKVLTMPFDELQLAHAEKRLHDADPEAWARSYVGRKMSGDEVDLTLINQRSPAFREAYKLVVTGEAESIKLEHRANIESARYKALSLPNFEPILQQAEMRALGDKNAVMPSEHDLEISHIWHQIQELSDGKIPESLLDNGRDIGDSINALHSRLGELRDTNIDQEQINILTQKVHRAPANNREYSVSEALKLADADFSKTYDGGSWNPQLEKLIWQNGSTEQLKERLENIDTLRDEIKGFRSVNGSDENLQNRMMHLSGLSEKLTLHIDNIEVESERLEEQQQQEQKERFSKPTKSHDIG